MEVSSRGGTPRSTGREEEKDEEGCSWSRHVGAGVRQGGCRGGCRDGRLVTGVGGVWITRSRALSRAGPAQHVDEASARQRPQGQCVEAGPTRKKVEPRQ